MSVVPQTPATTRTSSTDSASATAFVVADLPPVKVAPQSARVAEPAPGSAIGQPAAAAAEQATQLAELREALAASFCVEFRQLRVELVDGRLVLSGRLPSYFSRQLATQFVSKRCPGWAQDDRIEVTGANGSEPRMPRPPQNEIASNRWPLPSSDTALLPRPANS